MMNAWIGMGNSTGRSISALRVNRLRGAIDPICFPASISTNLRLNGDDASSLYLCGPIARLNERTKALGLVAETIVCPSDLR